MDQVERWLALLLDRRAIVMCMCGGGVDEGWGQRGSRKSTLCVEQAAGTSPNPMKGKLGY